MSGRVKYLAVVLDPVLSLKDQLVAVTANAETSVTAYTEAVLVVARLTPVHLLNEAGSGYTEVD